MEMGATSQTSGEKNWMRKEGGPHNLKLDMPYVQQTGEKKKKWGFKRG